MNKAALLVVIEEEEEGEISVQLNPAPQIASQIASQLSPQHRKVTRFAPVKADPWYPDTSTPFLKEFWDSMIRLKKGMIVHASSKLVVVGTYENGSGAMVQYLDPPKRKVTRHMKQKSRLKVAYEAEASVNNKPWMISLYVDKHLVSCSRVGKMVVNYDFTKEEED